LLAAVAVTAAVVALDGVPGIPDGVGRGFDWLVLALVAVGVVLVLAAPSRVAVVTTLGLVGFATALAFYTLGATDVAITQMLVEFLTVVVMMLLLVRLPGDFHGSSTIRAGKAAAVAVLAGVAATLWAVLVLADPGLSTVGRDYLDQAYELSGGTNVVNTILVDFRAIDTLGEMVVLGIAAIAVITALESRGALPHRPSPLVIGSQDPALDPVDNTVVLRATDRLVVPVLLGLSLWLFLRGHYDPGGGFIGALVAGSALALMFLAAPDDAVARLQIDYTRLIGAGMTIAIGAGMLGLLDGAYLRPLYADVLGLTLSTGLVFDVGVYLTVLGLVLATLARLGLEGPEPMPVRRPTSERQGS
jgi:multicomponent Na+:H+ antiporter subunit A